MTHGSYPNKRRASERRPRSSGPCVRKKTKTPSLKNQIRSAERVLRRNLPPEAREVQEKKLDELKKQQEIHSLLAIEREIFLRERKIKFLERRKIERRIRRLEKQHRASLEAEISAQLFNLKEDLEYVRFFPKREKYLSLFSGGEDEVTVEKRNRLREMIKANLVAAAASGKDLEETGSEDDGILDLSDCEFFLSGSSSDEADADDELTDKGTRAASGVSSDERNQEPTAALMPPPPPPRFVDCSTSSNTTSCGTTKKKGSSHSLAGQTGNMSSSSDARKPRRKRRTKMKQRQRRS